MSEKNETHDEMVRSCTWEVVQGIVRGDKLENVMHRVVNMVWFWHKRRIKEQTGKDVE